MSGGDRAVRGGDVGPSEDAAFWTRFLRGLTGVQLVISDAHPGLQPAIQAVFQGGSWQRGRVHAVRNLLATVPKSVQAMVVAPVRTIFVHPDQRAALPQLAKGRGDAPEPRSAGGHRAAGQGRRPGGLHELSGGAPGTITTVAQPWEPFLHDALGRYRVPEIRI